MQGPDDVLCLCLPCHSTSMSYLISLQPSIFVLQLCFQHQATFAMLQGSGKETLDALAIIAEGGLLSILFTEFDTKTLEVVNLFKNSDKGLIFRADGSLFAPTVSAFKVEAGKVSITTGPILCPSSHSVHTHTDDQYEY